MQFATAKAGIILVSVFVESCNLVYPRISQWLVSHQVYWDFTGFSEPGLKVLNCNQNNMMTMGNCIMDLKIGLIFSKQNIVFEGFCFDFFEVTSPGHVLGPCES